MTVSEVTVQDLHSIAVKRMRLRFACYLLASVFRPYWIVRTGGELLSAEYSYVEFSRRKILHKNNSELNNSPHPGQRCFCANVRISFNRSKA